MLASALIAEPIPRTLRISPTIPASADGAKPDLWIKSQLWITGHASSGDEVDGYPAERRTASMCIRGTQIHRAYPVTAVVTGWDEAQHAFVEVYLVLVADFGHRTPDQRGPPLGRTGGML